MPNPTPERHSTVRHRLALEIMRSALATGPAPMQAPGFPYPGQDGADDEIRKWAHQVTRYEADGHPYPAHACRAWSVACTRDADGTEVAGAHPHERGDASEHGVSMETRWLLAGVAVFLLAVVIVAGLLS